MQKLRSCGLFLATALLCVAAVQTISAQAEAEWPRPTRRRHGAQIRIGQDYHLPADQVVSRPVIVIGGSATLDGHVDDDVVVIGGDVRIGPAARIRGDVAAVFGEAQVADSAIILGEIHEGNIIWPDIAFTPFGWRWSGDRVWWALFGLAGTVFRLTLVLIAAAFLALIAPGWIRGIANRATRAPVASGMLGLATEILFVPVLIVSVLGLIISIVGIPLLIAIPFALAAFGIIWTAGFAAIAAQLGGRLRASPAASTPVGDVIIGIALLSSFTVVGHVLSFGPALLAPVAAAFGAAGLIIEYLAWTIGLGAALVAPLQNRRRIPPLPDRAPASATI